MIERVEDMLQRQIRDWPMLARGVEALAHAESRRLSIDWFEVYLRHIPHRVASTTAAVDSVSVGKRPCFLCAKNLPKEEEGLPFREDFVIYCNPFPIVAKHLTIAHRDHVVQRIEGRFGVMLDLAAALPGYFVIYNGPECGASAPDHMHFQAGLRNDVPIIKDSALFGSTVVSNYGRRLLLFRGGDHAQLIDVVERAMSACSDVTGKGPEALVNIAVSYEHGQWTIDLFLRAKHRPEVFHTGELTVSPATIDLCGVVVVPIRQDFEKVTREQVAAIFDEVMLSAEQFAEVARRLEESRCIYPSG